MVVCCVQFVNFTEIMSQKIPVSKKETEFALAALMETPTQYNATLDLQLLGYNISIQQLRLITNYFHDLKMFPPFFSAAVGGELLGEFLSLLLLGSAGQPRIQTTTYRTTWNRELEFIINLLPLRLKVIHAIRYVMIMCSCECTFFRKITRLFFYQVF